MVHDDNDRKAKAGRGSRSLDLGSLSFFVSKPWILAPGIWLAWFWLAFEYDICAPATFPGFRPLGVAFALAGAAAVFIVCGFRWQQFQALGKIRVFPYATGAIACLASWFLAMNGALNLPAWLCVLLCLFAGICSATILLLSLICFVHFTFRQAFVALHISLLACFFAFFVTLSLPTAIRPVLFAILPLLAVLTVAAELRGLQLSTWRFADTGQNASRPKRMHWDMLGCYAFLFMTVSFIRSLAFSGEGLSQVAAYSAPSAVTLITIIATGIIMAECYSFFTTSYLTYYYVFASLMVSFIAVSRAIGVTANFLLSMLEGAAGLLLCILLLCSVFAEIIVYRRHPVEAAGKTLGVAAGGCALGWILREVIGLVYPAANASVAFLVAFSFLNLAIFLFGFSPNSLQKFITGGVEETAEPKGGMPRKPEKMTFEEAALKVSEEGGLTEREREVFLLLASGESSQKIADSLVISYHTVRAHIRNIYAKLDVHSYQEMRDKVNAVLERDESVAPDGHSH